MKCFILSLHRCGTRSAIELLRMLGLQTVHWPVLDGKMDLRLKVAGRETDLGHVLDVVSPVIDRYQAASDVPLPALYKQLYTRHPGAKFVLLHRDPASWARSVRKHVGARDFDPFERVQYWHYFTDRPLSLAVLSDEQLEWMHRQHSAEVMAFFAEHAPDQFLAGGLEDSDCGPRIGAFLDCEHAPALPRLPLRRVKPVHRSALDWRFFRRRRGVSEARG
jgi:hypothetical protein